MKWLAVFMIAGILLSAFSTANAGVTVFNLFSDPGPQFNLDGLFIGICKPTLENWGWHTVEPPHPRFDFAAAALGHGGPWESFGTDMAFELMIPEPATIALLGFGTLSLVTRRRTLP